ncbi:hypothetical protein [Micromonospora sp. NPDC004551]|uniref:hypothetical protein n=1 Tax=Micromonospora sp. NPDC004551 TaxID=3154284 RepID=UPI0033B5C559
MPITLSAGRRIAAGLLGAAVAVTAAATPAAAAPAAATGPLSVTAQTLVLNPTSQGYEGTLTATVTNNGTTGDYPSVFLTEPAGGSFTTVDPGFGCVILGLVENRMQHSCASVAIQPGETQTWRLGFHVWTTPRKYAMSATGGEFGVMSNGSSEMSDTVGFTTLFQSTNGSLKKPQPYVQATRSDLSVTAGAVSLNRQADGSLQGRMPVTVRYGNDAPSFGVDLTAALPAGVVVDHTEPQDMPSGGDWFSVPGTRFMPGEQRTFDVVLTAPAGTPAGALGTASYTAAANYCYCAPVEDISPADNTASFTVTAVG